MTTINEPKEHYVTTTNELIDAFLYDGCYEDLNAWMRDSDYDLVDGEWTYDHEPVDPVAAVLGAIEASGFQR